MKKTLALIIVLIIFLTTVGCQSTDVNDTAVPIGIGIDWEDTNEFKVSAQLAKPQQAGEGGQEEKNKDTFIVVSKTGETLSMAARNINLILPRTPLWEFASVMIFGEKLVSQDACLYVDTLARIPTFRTNTLMLVSKDATPEELLQAKTPLEPLSALGMAQLVRLQEKQLGIYIPMSMGDFLTKISTPGIDPLIPTITLIKEKDDKILKLDGNAVFAKGRMVGSLNEKESRGYRFTIPKIQQGGLISIPDPNDSKDFVAIEIIRTEAKIKPHIDDEGNITMNIKVIAEGNFYEQHTTQDLVTLKGFRIMEELASKEIEKEISLAVTRAQELNSDFFGWGRLVSISYPKVWRKISEDWYDYFPQVEVNIEVKFDLRRSYLTTHTFQFR